MMSRVNRIDSHIVAEHTILAKYTRRWHKVQKIAQTLRVLCDTLVTKCGISSKIDGQPIAAGIVGIYKPIMSRWIATITILLVAGCTSPVPKAYYQLPSITESGVNNHNHQGTVLIEPVIVADILNYDGIVLQTNDVQYVVASNNLWLTPLDRQLQQTLADNLSTALPNWLVLTRNSELSGANITVSMNVANFNSRYDGYAVIRGSWVITEHSGQTNGKSQITRQSFNLLLPLEEDGYPSLVRALGQGWQQQAANIAKIIGAKMQ